MPLSDHRQYSTVVDAVLRRQPRHVLDIGVGHGVYGKLIRTHMPEVLLYGFEPWLPYAGFKERKRYRRWQDYNHVFTKAWPPNDDDLLRVDLALMIDVLEHYDGQASATRALDALVGATRAVVVAYPKDALRPDLTPDYDNPYEQHRWQPTLHWLADRAPWVLVEAHDLPDSVVAVLEVPA